MSRSTFTRTLLLGAMLTVRNAVQWAFLLDGRHRARRAGR